MRSYGGNAESHKRSVFYFSRGQQVRGGLGGLEREIPQFLQRSRAKERHTCHCHLQRSPSRAKQVCDAVLGYIPSYQSRGACDPWTMGGYAYMQLDKSELKSERVVHIFKPYTQEAETGG